MTCVGVRPRWALNAANANMNLGSMKNGVFHFKRDSAPSTCSATLFRIASNWSKCGCPSLGAAFIYS